MTKFASYAAVAVLVLATSTAVSTGTRLPLLQFADATSYGNGTMAARAMCEAQGKAFIPVCVQIQPSSDPDNPIGECVRAKYRCVDSEPQPN
jgi:hypothetical protein